MEGAAIATDQQDRLARFFGHAPVRAALQHLNQRPFGPQQNRVEAAALENPLPVCRKLQYLKVFLAQLFTVEVTTAIDVDLEPRVIVEDQIVAPLISGKKASGFKTLPVVRYHSGRKQLLRKIHRPLQ